MVNATGGAEANVARGREIGYKRRCLEPSGRRVRRIPRAGHVQKGDPMDVSSGAVATAVNAVSSTPSALSVVALKSAEKEQTSVLQLFNNVSAPPLATGRGQNLDITA